MDLAYEKPLENIVPSWHGQTPNVAKGLTQELLGKMNIDSQAIAFEETFN
jgi:hypothetical protein